MKNKRPAPRTVVAPKVPSAKRPDAGDARVAQSRLPATRNFDARDGHFAVGELVPMLRSGPGICEICSQPSDQYKMCYSCRQCVEGLDGHRTHVMPIALSVKGGPLATALWQYKDAQYQWEREAATRRLGDLAQTYLDRHETCLAESVAAVAFDIVTWVPSTASRPGTHPLADLLYSLPWAAGRVADGFAPAGGAVRGKAHHADADRFVAKPALRGKHVLIVDDTWTRGANALSAASAARKAGARTVAVAVIGRHFDEHYRDSTRDYVKAAKTLGFDFATCIYCDEQNPPAPAASRATAGTDENRRHTGEPRRTQLPPAASARPITGSGYSWESLPKLPKR